MVEDSWVWGSAIAHQLGSRPGVRVVGPARSVDEALASARAERPIVALVDLNLVEDSGLRFVRTAVARGLGTRSVIVTSEPTAWALGEARAAGAFGFVGKDDLDTGDKVWTVVEAVAGGRTVFSEVTAADGGVGASVGASLGLSPSDVELVRCFSQGMNTQAIARQLSLGEQTVRNRTTVIGGRLGVSGRLEIVAMSLRLGIIEPPTDVEPG